MSILFLAKIPVISSLVEEIPFDLLQIPWKPTVLLEVDSTFGVTATVDISVDSTILVSEDLYSEYSMRWLLWEDILVDYAALTNSETSIVTPILVEVVLDSSYRVGMISRDLDSKYSMRGTIVQDNLCPFDIQMLVVHSDLLVPYAYRVHSDTALSYGSITRVFLDIDSPCGNISSIYKDTEWLYNLANNTPVFFDSLVLFTLYDPTSEATVTQCSCSVGLDIIEFEEISFSHDSEGYCWNMTGTLSSQEDWLLCTPGNTLRVLLGTTDEFVFLIDSRNRNLSFESHSYSIEGRSPTSVLGEGSLPIHKTWSMLDISDIIEELNPGTVQDIISWKLPDGRLTSDGDIPIVILSKIAAARGCSVYTDGPGILHVVPKYRNMDSPLLWPLDLSDFFVSDFNDIFSLSDSLEKKPGYNEVDVSDEPDSGDSFISLSEISRDTSTYSVVLKATVFPFVNTLTLHSSYSGVTPEPSLAEVEEEVEETIEIIDGLGSTSAPVYSMVSSSYNDFNLGLVYFSGTKITTEILSTSLLSVKYVTRYHTFPIKVGLPISVQVYTEG